MTGLDLRNEKGGVKLPNVLDLWRKALGKDADFAGRRGMMSKRRELTPKERARRKKRGKMAYRSRKINRSGK